MSFSNPLIRHNLYTWFVQLYISLLDKYYYSYEKFVPTKCMMPRLSWFQTRSLVNDNWALDDASLLNVPALDPKWKLVLIIQMTMLHPLKEDSKLFEQAYIQQHTHLSNPQIHAHTYIWLPRPKHPLPAVCSLNATDKKFNEQCLHYYSWAFPFLVLYYIQHICLTLIYKMEQTSFFRTQTQFQVKLIKVKAS